MILTRGASAESINALPTYKFKAKRIRSADESEIDSDGEGGIVAAGTDKERVISAEDAVSCTYLLYSSKFFFVVYFDFVC